MKRLLKSLGFKFPVLLKEPLPFACTAEGLAFNTTDMLTLELLRLHFDNTAELG